MEKKRILHIADLHLNGSDPSTALRCLETAFASAIAYEVDCVVIAGDIWHKRIEASDQTPLVQSLRMVRELATQIPVVVLYGNHDPQGSLEPFAEMSESVFVFSKPVPALIAGIQFLPLPYPNKARIMGWLSSSDQDATDAAAEEMLRRVIMGFAAHSAKSDPFGCPRVMLYHGNVRGCTVDSGQQMLGGDIMLGALDLEQSGADYVAMGHIHMRQTLGTRCVYPGSLYHNDFGEHGRKVALIVDVWRDLVPGAPGFEIVAEVEMPSRAKITVDTSALDDGLCAIDDSDQVFMRDADVKIRVRMTPEQSPVFQQNTLERFAVEVLGAHSAKVERIVIPTERVRCEAITETRMLRDKVAAWGGATSTEIPAGVLGKADVLEGGAR